MMNTSKVLVVDDEAVIRTEMVEWLNLSGFHAEAAADGASAIKAASSGSFEVVVTDIRMPGMTGLDLLRHLRDWRDKPSVVVMTGHGDVPLAVEAMRGGAEDFFEKPFNADALVERLRLICEKRALRREIEWLKRQLEGDGSLEKRLVGMSAHARQARSFVASMREQHNHAIIVGPSSSGRRHMAGLIAEAGNTPPFVLDLAGLAEDEMALALFGGATYASPPGALRDGDERNVVIANADRMGRKFACALRDGLANGCVVPVGSQQSLGFSSRVILTASPGPVADALASTPHIAMFHTIDLGARGEDVMPLYRHFVAQACRLHGISDDRIAAMPEAVWPANGMQTAVAGLREAAFAMVSAHAHGHAVPTMSMPEMLRRVECDMIRNALSACDGRRMEAAQRLGIAVRTLSEKIARYGL